LWDQLRRARVFRLRAVGDLPEPAPIDAPPGTPPRALLTRAAERIDDTVRPPARRPLSPWVLALLPLLGALVAGCTGLLAAGLVTVGESQVIGGTVIRGAGWLAFLTAPSAGVPVAAALAHRRLHSRLDIGGIGLTLLGGMVAATVLSLTFAASH
jgi:hypothetical protein